MIKTINIQTVLNISPKVKVSPGELLELSLDCFICGRTHRTVGLRDGAEEAICTPTKHPFPAKILDKRSDVGERMATLFYRVEYWFAPFEDLKRKRPAAELPRWSRVHFEMACPRCGERRARSVQNNIVRPWTCVCECGHHLYTEEEEYPRFSLGSAAA